MTGLGLHDEEIRQGIMDLCGKGKGKGKGAVTKRKFTSDMDRPLPDREVGEVVLTDLDFEEILYEEVSPCSSICGAFDGKMPPCCLWGSWLTMTVHFFLPCRH